MQSPYENLSIKFPNFYGSGKLAIEQAIIETLKIFIKEECSNREIKEADYVKREDADELMEKTGLYRNIRYAWYHIGEKEKQLIDLFWFFYVEFPQYSKDVLEDYEKSVAVPDGEPKWINREKKKGEKFFALGRPNKNRKYPDYKRRYEYKGFPSDHLRKVKWEKINEVLELIDYMEI